MGLPASKRRAKDAGLLLAYEKTGYDKTGAGRLPDLLDDWSVRRLKEAGADCIKILLYYTPFDPGPINNIKHAWVERIGDECRANDIPFFLEFVGYDEGADEKGLDFAKKKPQIVTGSMAEFTKDRYGVDVMKVEVPVNMKFVEGTKSFGGRRPTRGTRQWMPSDVPPTSRHGRSSICRPASATQSSPRRSSSQAKPAPGSRACSADARRGRTACRLRQAGCCRVQAWLDDQGVKNISNVNDHLKPARPWFEFYGAKSAEELR